MTTTITIAPADLFEKEPTKRSYDGLRPTPITRSGSTQSLSLGSSPSSSYRVSALSD